MMEPNVLLDFDHVSMCYHDESGETEVLRDFSMQVKPGEFVALLGPSGCGKSTVLGLAAGLLRPDEGTVRLRGEPVLRPPERMGYMLQRDHLFPWLTVRENALVGIRVRQRPTAAQRAQVERLLQACGLTGFADALPGQLSGGMRQRAALVRTLAVNPDLLLLDEPTSQLDPVAEKNFLHALFRVNRELGCTVVVATHQPRPMLEYATCAYRIEGGRVREVADMASLGRRESLFSDDTLGWGAIRCAKNGVFSRREDNLGSLEPPGGVSSAKKSLELDKSSEFVAQTSLENGSEAFPRTDGSRILQKMHGGSATTLSEGWFRYNRAGGWVLRGLDVAFSAGAVHAVVGGNGCGKSTMLSVLAKTAKLQRAERPRRRCCLRIPKHCWLPRRFAMS